MSSPNAGGNPGHVVSPSPRSLSADVFEVLCTREEIVLAFGTLGDAGDRRAALIPAALASRVVLSPYGAKRLAARLRGAIGDYESRFGSLNGEVPVFTPPGSGPPPPTATATPEQTMLRADTLRRLVASLGTACGLERSFKMSAGSLMTNRFILMLKKDDVAGDPEGAFSAVFRELGMPEGFLRDCREQLGRAEFVHFGFEERHDGCTYKVYLEFKPAAPTDPGTDGGGREPYLVFLGFKWDPDAPQSCAVSRYLCYPGLSLPEIQGKLGVLFKGNPGCTSFETARAVLGEIAGDLSGAPLTYVEVSEENNPRRSFDLNFYGSPLGVGHLRRALQEGARRYGLPGEHFQRFSDSINGKRFGHLSGGGDRAGRDFLTVYYGLVGVGP